MKNLKIGIKIFALLLLITGIVYPLIITGVAQVFFKGKANGSIIYIDNKPLGSKLIGQPFESPNLFWPRPSSTEDFPYNALASGGSNLGPTNPVLIKDVENRIKYFKANGEKTPIPSCLVLGSGSALDPDVIPQAAYFQIERISKHTHIPSQVLKELVKQHTHKRLFGFLGQEYVNVVELNLALVKLEKNYGNR